VVGFYLSGHPLDQYKFEIEHFCNTALGEFQDLQKLMNKRMIKTGGIVTAFQHRVAKNGRPFGTLTVEDYTDSFTFFLFSDDYTRLKEFFMLNWFLYIEGYVTVPEWKKNGEPDFKIQKMELLSEIRDKKCQGLEIQCNIGMIDSEMLTTIGNLVKENQGNHTLKFSVVDPADNVSLEMLSRKFKVEINDNVLAALDELPQISFKLATA